MYWRSSAVEERTAPFQEPACKTAKVFRLIYNSRIAVRSSALGRDEVRRIQPTERTDECGYLWPVFAIRAESGKSNPPEKRPRGEPGIPVDTRVALCPSGEYSQRSSAATNPGSISGCGDIDRIRHPDRPALRAAAQHLEIHRGCGLCQGHIRRIQAPDTPLNVETG